MKKIIFVTLAVGGAILSTALFTNANDITRSQQGIQMEKPEFRKDFMRFGQRFAPGMHKVKGGMKYGMKGPNIMEGLDDDTIAKLKDINETYRAKAEKVMNTYKDMERTEENMKAMHTEMDIIKEQHFAEIKPYLSEEKIAELEAHRKEMQENMQKAGKAHMNTKTYQKHIDVISNKLDHIEQKLGLEKAQAVYAQVITKLQEKITTIEENGDAANNIKEILQAVIAELESRMSQ